jgi:DNA-binding transcriptional regulator/RsmH inhibitor MraZ
VTVSDPVKMDALSLLGANSIQVTCDKAGRITLNEHIVKEARLEREVIFRGAFTTFQLASPTPPKADRDSESAKAILRALRELGL